MDREASIRYRETIRNPKELTVKIDASVKSPTSSGVKETEPRAAKAGSGAPTAAPQGTSGSQDNV
ncbi:MAG: hypothetical protein Q8J61_00850, partial [Sulfuricella sp.]|nr:hypothetical protein [Sulfuricella sp.]